MDYQEFKKTLIQEFPPKDYTAILKSLWYDAKGKWEASHDIVDGMNNATAKWVHAYLHRKEGDEWNARYWYRLAGRPFPRKSLEEEQQEIVEFVLNQ